MRVLAAAMPVIKTSGHSCLHALLLSVPAGACCQLTSQAVFTVAVDGWGRKGMQDIRHCVRPCGMDPE